MKAGDYTQEKEEIRKELEELRKRKTAKRVIAELESKRRKGGKTRRRVHRKRYTRK
jgi:hypothetical protein